MMKRAILTAAILAACDKESGRAPIEVDATKLHADYAANEIAADLEYKDRTLIVSGTIGIIGNSTLAGPYITLTADSLVGVTAYFDSPSVLTPLRKGDTVTVRCVGRGVTIGIPVLKDCTMRSK